MLRSFFLFFLTLAFSIYGIVGGVYADNLPKTLKWAGCDISKKAFMFALAKGYEKKTGIRIIIEGGGATKGIRDVASGYTDLGGTCRHKLNVKEEKTSTLSIIGWDAIVIVTHSNNPTKNISFDELFYVFKGTITNWEDLGGDNASIQVVARKGKISGVGRMARELIFDDPNANFVDSALIMDSSGPVEKYVESNIYAIALSGISSARKRDVKILHIDGYEPSYKNIISGYYPLYRPLYLVSHVDAAPEIKDFIDYALSPEGQEIIKNEGTVNLKDGEKLMQDFFKKEKTHSP